MNGKTLRWFCANTLRAATHNAGLSFFFLFFNSEGALHRRQPSEPFLQVYLTGVQLLLIQPLT